MSIEKERVLPLGELLSQETQRALIDWTIRRREALEKAKTKSGGRPRPQREKKQIYQTNSTDRGRFITQRIAHLLPEEGFSQVFGNHVNSFLQGRIVSEQLNYLAQNLESLNQEQVDLAFRFYQIRRKFGQNPEQADLIREQISQFNLKHVSQVPESGFLPGFLATISNLYPDPKALKK
ncbi:MAG: hypothetical protein PHR64_00180 [Candidatus Shapirobacteria bacterium]|nr:hypothetical protein [Candidatus Shapirobacteria bacterium]MDD5073603.1 hypothetical protein [Candidatus Shapirobacteria bacterium]MDD5481356.1 hypothetical protein [Candidatus Shapirobacteria bacterium]